MNGHHFEQAEDKMQKDKFEDMHELAQVFEIEGVKSKNGLRYRWRRKRKNEEK